jgi:hypothetical protein
MVVISSVPKLPDGGYFVCPETPCPETPPKLPETPCPETPDGLLGQSIGVGFVGLHEISLALHNANLILYCGKCTLSGCCRISGRSSGVDCLLPHCVNLLLDGKQCHSGDKDVGNCYPHDDPIWPQKPNQCALIVCMLVICAFRLCRLTGNRWVRGRARWWDFVLMLSVYAVCGLGVGLLIFGRFFPPQQQKCSENTEYRQPFQHDGENVSQKYIAVVGDQYYPFSGRAITAKQRPPRMQMDHAWHTKITVSCITAVAIIEAAGEALSRAPGVRGDFSAFGWLHYVPLLLLIIAGIAWLNGRRQSRGHNNLPPKLVIYSAYYGTSTTDDRDVTETVRQLPKDAVAIVVDNNTLQCDPAPNKPEVKRLRVRYSYGNDVISEVSLPEHSRMVLPQEFTYKRK